MQYLTHTAHWRDLVLTVGPGVLIPRPETEQLIDLVETANAQRTVDQGHPWVDLGTGTGAIAISLSRVLGEVLNNKSIRYRTGSLPSFD